MRASRTLAAAAVVTLAFGATACGSSSSDSSSSSSGGSGKTLTIRGCTPENPLIGTTTNEVCGGNPLDAISAKLVHYNADTAAPENDIAESITTKDNQLFTVKIKKGYKFSDGTEVKAKNFVDAWNWGAYAPNAQLNSYFFEIIKGFDDEQCADEKCTTAPKAKTMSGLKVVDDHTFTIQTTQKVSNLPMRLGYTAFMPQPDSFFADTSAKKATFAKMPVAAGPYKVVKNDATGIYLEKNSNYSGKFPGSVDKVTFKTYNDLNAAYNDVVSNNLDVTDVIPADQLVGNQWKSDLVNDSTGEDRYADRATGVIQVLTFSPKDSQLTNVKMRQALSMAINRKQITDKIFNGARVPATGWVSPVVDGYKAGACGSNCTWTSTTAATAKKLYTEAGGYKGTLQIYVNGDGGHKLWADAVCNQWKATLGLSCETTLTPDFATLRKGINARDYKGVYRGGWQMDYPSIEDFLSPIYRTKASSNDGDYSSKTFDATMDKADAASTTAQANALYQQAEQILGKDMPTIPLWYQNSQFGWSTNVKKIKMTPFSTFDLSSVEMN